MAETVKARRAKPLFRPELKNSPAHPLGGRVFLRPFPPAEETEGGLVTPDIAKEWLHAGQVVAAGDSAADKLFDYGVELGDEVWYGKYAGVVEAWQRIVRPGKGECAHEGVWEFVSIPGPDQEMRKCRNCGAERLSERMIMINVDDVICSVDLQCRIERGEVKRVQGQDADGRTRYYLTGVKDTFSTGAA